jgi:pSer/pThr/pTyr-binding forkhead associated (FHA) protein
MNPGDPRDPPGGPRRHATVLESVEDLRAQIRKSATVVEPRPVEARGSAAPTVGQPGDTLAFRPTLRPPLALLTVLDDGSDTGEVLRIRGGSFVIGRVDGDLVIPHDSGISGRHAEICRRLENGAYRWYLKDLQSTNGTFVRASSMILGHQQEFLVGSRRFRFQAPAPPTDPNAASDQSVNATRKWQTLSSGEIAAALHPTLIEITPGAAERSFSLAQQEQWLGRDPAQCTIFVDDPMIDRKHARIYRDGNNRWIAVNVQSVNGLWARIHEVGLGRGGLFQCGEQQFLIKVL